MFLMNYREKIIQAVGLFHMWIAVAFFLPEPASQCGYLIQIMSSDGKNM